MLEPYPIGAEIMSAITNSLARRPEIIAQPCQAKDGDEYNECAPRRTLEVFEVLPYSHVLIRDFLDDGQVYSCLIEKMLNTSVNSVS